MNAHISISRFGETEHAVSRVLEMLLSCIGLNQDIVNFNRFKTKSCKHVGCNCIVQPKDSVLEFATTFAEQRTLVNSLNSELKTANFNTKIEIIDS